MFDAKTGDISLLREGISAISELIDEAELRITKDGISMTAADRAVVVVVEFKIFREIFDEYVCEKDLKIGVNLLSLLHILKRANDSDRVSLGVHGNRMNIVLEGNSKRSFTLPLLDMSRDEVPPLDKLEFPASLSINTDILNSGIEDADLITDSIIFTLNKDQLTMRSESDASSTQLDLTSGTSHLNVITANAPVRARYSLDYLKKIIKARKIAGSATLSFANDYPMKIQFDVPEKLNLGFVLAPRVEEG